MLEKRIGTRIGYFPTEQKTERLNSLYRSRSFLKRFAKREEQFRRYLGIEEAKDLPQQSHTYFEPLHQRERRFHAQDANRNYQKKFFADDITNYFIH